MFFEPGILYRLPLYMIYGLVCEVLFTATCDLLSPHFLKTWNVVARESINTQPMWRIPGRDKRAMGYTFLWMLPIYALLIFLEPISKMLAQTPLMVRGGLYVLGLWFVEYTTGFLIKKISGRCPWDYSASRYNLHGFIRFDFFIFWLVFMLVAEKLTVKFIALTPALMQIFGG
ncbi:putative ABC transporter permease [bacterium]|nr:putative ABC transporter permease [bacterium]